MAHIHVLDEATINKIAAGEVVERPASVIKELLENAVDAGATSIDVEIAEGGVAYMRVTDNGIGMTEEDARLAVLRHATSKIASVDDLFAIASLGFRGEALASIASVSHFSLTTRTADNEMGTRITIDGGHDMECMPYGAQPGTTIEVRDLFYNTPARRKFLKTERTETAKIQDMVGKLALSNPHIAFKLVSNDKVSLITPGSGDITDTIAALYGYKVKEDLFPVAYEIEGVRVDGVVSKPTLLKSSRIWQTVIVNNRVIGDKAINKAIDNAYHALLPKGGYPLVVLSIVVPPEVVDINVHPRKSEVKFSDDKPIFKAVYHGVLQALEHPLRQVESGRLHQETESVIATDIRYEKVFEGRRNLSLRPDEGDLSIGTNSKLPGNVGAGYGHDRIESTHNGTAFTHNENASAYDDSESNQGAGKAAWERRREKTNELVEKIRSGEYVPQRPVRYEQEQLGDDSFVTNAHPSTYTPAEIQQFSSLQEVYRQDGFYGKEQRRERENDTASSAAAADSGNESAAVAPDGLPQRVIANSGLVPLGQVADCYIVAKKGNDLYIIDQHAAHERIRYDKLCKSAVAIPMQELLIPLMFDATDEEQTLVDEQAEAFADLGFAVALGGPTQIRVDGVPSDLVENKAIDVLRHTFTYMLDGEMPTKAQLRHEMLAYASCRGAIKAGHSLNMYQISVLIEDLFATDKPYVCPHGRPTIIRFTPDELGKLFKRS
ncbi:DNA mismatch repair endonuclease MutL [Veillonella magna]|uniref:DNA mismatch repair protein MutL n=1 Tax=Veillonella magna TaxID=464322 RepID=A0ABS2GC46_9FIRM|nr:DNA mismatch repair endonuclease MutL [Veillonella magna]MBM6823370.1 DNA mismatch repair endonuclease MutL [Veillonella magna]MBM6911714.1 DNA mismatch repair endonuclease MutL [Veillonella magna]